MREIYAVASDSVGMDAGFSTSRGPYDDCAHAGITPFTV